MSLTKFNAQYLPYHETHAFTNIVEDYLKGEPALKDFYQHSPDIVGIKEAISVRKNYNYNRNLLVKELFKQYDSGTIAGKVKANIEALLSDNTFTICTAHQPNIFTGHLYFIYKILHAIKLAEELNEKIAGYNFVPVYYMGSEDADLEELGEICINGKNYKWSTDQKGAVGRMKVDTIFIDLINEIDGQLSVEPFGKEIISLLRQSYSIGKTIQQSTFELVNKLFEDKGLIIFLPDNSELKKEFFPVNQKELLEQFSQKAVAETVAAFPGKYKVQAAGRNINLFYLMDNLRERIEYTNNEFKVANTNIVFTTNEIIDHLNEYPERFSPNVILRPVFQEMILPNVAFIGGGGELAYWLELKKVFDNVNVPFPVLLLRNSFMIVDKKTATQISKLNFTITDFFKPDKELTEMYVRRETGVQLELTEEKNAIRTLYSKIGTIASITDITLKKHVEALSIQVIKKIDALEKKMLIAEKKKFETAQRQITKIKSSLFPSDILQERVENLMSFYSIWGKDFIDNLYLYSKGLSHEFCIIEEA